VFLINGSGKVIPVHTLKHIREVEEQFHLFSALDVSGQPLDTLPKHKSRYPLKRGPVGTRSGEEENNLLPSLGFELRTDHPAAQ